MATQFATMPAHAHSRPTPTLKTENFDMESLFDFNQGGPSPTAASNSKTDATPKQDWSPYEPLEEQHQQFSGPSHDYNQHKQQVGLPVGTMANIPPSGMFDGYGSNVGDLGFNSGFDSYNSGIDMEGDMTMDFNQPQPAMFFAAQRQQGQADAFVNPNTIGGQEEAPGNVGRLWPGMHSQQAQQAAMQKAQQQQMIQQRQMKMQAYQQHRQSAAGPSQPQQQQQPQQGHGKRASNAVEPHVEESISRLLNQMRHNSTASNGSDDGGSPGGVLPHIARMRKDEEEMDEDERLLASDEGKKLSSKERRQLRNKVSARAFRSRRKEYISQLEGEVAVKSQEAQDLRNQNTALANENERYRGLIETLLRHPSFSPFIEDISKNPAALGAVPPPANGMQMQSSNQPTPTPTQQAPQQQNEDVKPEYMNFDGSQMQMSSQEQQQQQPQQQQNQQVGLAMIPETDFSKLNINGFGRALNFNQFQSVNAFPVTSLPPSPDHIDLLADLPASHFSTTAASSSDSNMDILLAKLGRSAVNLGSAFA